jgi:hypothetical protein
MSAKSASATAPAPSSPAAELVDRLFATIEQPAGPNIAVVIERVESAYSARSVEVEIRPAPIVQNLLDQARKAQIKAEIAGDADAESEAAKRVADLEREISSSAMKLQALAELREERREAVNVAHAGLSEAVAVQRERIQSAAKALEDEARRLKAIAWAAKKAIETDSSLFDPYGASVKTPDEQAAIDQTRSVFPPLWRHAFGTWQRVQSYLCRP